MSISFELLKESASKGRIAHFLLFHGSGAEERFQAVLDLSMLLNCKGEENLPCRDCAACKKILNGNHPDIQIIKPLKTSIGIEQVLTLQNKVYRKLYEGNYRVCLIEEADKLTLPAANALLKIAEEPPDQTVIILSTNNAEGIIPTLRSRAQTVYYDPPTEGEWEENIEIFRLSGNNPDLARKISSLGLEKVKRWLEIYQMTVVSGDFVQLFALFPLEKEESIVLLQVLTESLKNKVVLGVEKPVILKELAKTEEAVRKQANHRLALEVLALKHIKLGGTKIG